MTNDGFRWCIDRPYEPATHEWCTGHLGYQLGGSFVIRLDAARTMTGSAELYGFPVEICRATVQANGRADFAFCSGGAPGVPGVGWFTADGFVGEIWEGGERYKNGYLHATRAACGVLASGESLTPGQEVSACAGGARLVHQLDGNVVAYRGGTATWNSGTNGRATTQLVMQTDGNLVLYGPGGSVVWSSGTAGNPGATLSVRDDGILELRAAGGSLLWP